MAAKPLCSIPECDKPTYARGWCKKHYARYLRNGDPLTTFIGPKKTQPEPCLIADCSSSAIIRGWCKNHYERWRKYGSPTDGKPSPARAGEPLEYIRKIIVSDTGLGCIIWPYSKNSRGYGTVRFEGRYHSAARVACLLAHGHPPTPDHEAAHSCGNGHNACVNPRHLRWATPHENRQDKIDHGRSGRGESHPRGKLTEDDIRAIRRLGGSMLQREIAAIYGVTATHIGFVLARKTWAWLDD